MQTFTATEVSSADDASLDHGEGWLSFHWADPVCGTEGLTIDCEGHCARVMPVRSGQGPPHFVDVQRDRVCLRFSSALAKQLELNEEIEIRFSLSDDEFSRLRRTIKYYDETGQG